MAEITRSYHLVGAKRIAESTFDATPQLASCANGHAFPFFGNVAVNCPTCKNDEITKPDPLPDRRVLEFHPEPASPETFIGDGIQRFVLKADDPILAELAIDSEWTISLTRKAAE